MRQTELHTFPVPLMGLQEAVAMQYHLVDLIHRHFDGVEILQAGDYGVNLEYGRPRAAAKVEAVLAEFFEAEEAVLVRGAGTGAIRTSFMANLKPGDPILIHAAPVFSTTKVTFRAMGLELVQADFNHLKAVERAVDDRIKCAYVQHSRQLLADRYELARVIRTIKRVSPNLPIIIDDNYTAMAVPKIGCQLGASLSAFSLFKILGPPGVGCVVGDSKYIDPIRDDAYSGGSKVQGPEAMDALRSLVYAPVSLALRAAVIDELVTRLNAGEVDGVARALVASHQSRTALVELENPIAGRVIKAAVRFGAAPYPVGAESRFEVSAMFYRLSKAMREADPSLGDRVLRINPFRAGADTVIRILKAALEQTNTM